MQRKKFISIGVTSRAREELKIATLDLSAALRRQRSMSDVILAALGVALRHRNELLAELASDVADTGH